jgi:SAM-dependent methyltransferase
MERFEREGRLVYSPSGYPQYKRYLDEMPGQLVQDVWTDIQPINNRSREKLGYPTQKPVDLLERIIEASSNPDDVVLDPFCGCGTTIDAAQKLGRQWIGIDITFLAIDLIDKRLRDSYGDEVAETYTIHGIPRDEQGAMALFRENPFDFERWAVSLVHGQPNEKQVGDKGFDGVIRFLTDNKGGTGRALVSVKGGKTVTPAMVQELVGAMSQHNADMGIFICQTKPTKGMVEVAQHSGSYVWPVSETSYPRVQLFTVAELLHGRRPNMPTPIKPYMQAKKLALDDQMSLGL